MDPTKWADAIIKVLTYTGPLVPIPLGWLLIGAGGLFAAYKFLGLILRRKS